MGYRNIRCKSPPPPKNGGLLKIWGGGGDLRRFMSKFDFWHQSQTKLMKSAFEVSLPWGGIYGVQNYDIKFSLNNWGGYLQRIQRYLRQDSSNAHAQIDLLLSKQKTKNPYKFSSCSKNLRGEKDIL